MGYAKHEIGVMRAARDKLAEGETVRSVARSFGVSPSTVSRWGAGAVRVDPVEKERKAEIQNAQGSDVIGAALSVPLNSLEGESVWAEYGRAHPVRGIAPDQAARIFEAVAYGLSFPLAFEAAGLKGGDAEIYQARCKEGIEPEASFFRALKICRCWLLMRASKRVSEGLAGWQGAGRLLGALDPANWGEKPDEFGGESSLDDLTREAILEICERQIAAKRGAPLRYNSIENPEIIPLSETGMNDDEGESPSR